MRVLVHDFGGYPFPIQLSRELARRGHTVAHVFCASLATTPRGPLERRGDDPSTLEIYPIALDQPVAKYSFIKRWQQENEIGRRVSRRIVSWKPDVVLSANTPLDAQRTLLQTCNRLGIPFCFWLQDLIGVASEKLLGKKIPVIGKWIGLYYARLERGLLLQSDRVVVITNDFRPILVSWGLEPDRIHVVENWAPLDNFPVRPKDTPWSRQHDLAGSFCFMYTGTMGMKHNPALILELATSFKNRPDVRVVVTSQGLGAGWLEDQKRAAGLDNLVLLPFQPFDVMPDALGAADVLMAVLEPEASEFSVPSKVLSYLCAARPLLLSVPYNNLAARIVSQQNAGLVVEPGDTRGFVNAAGSLLEDRDARSRMAVQARTYAETTFDLQSITDRFEQILVPGEKR